MRKLAHAIPLLLLFAILGLARNSAEPVSANTNLLQNPGFEGEYTAWLPQFSTAYMAPNWTPWWVNDPNHNPEWAMPEYKAAEGRFFPDRVYEGALAQQWFSFHRSHYAGLYQQVSNVTPGQTYRLTVWVQVWSSTSDQARPSVGPGNPQFKIGIEPNGKTSAGPVGGPPSTVVWSPEAPFDQVIDQWYQHTVEAVALNDTITVYMSSSPQYAVKHNDIYVDAANLIAVGSAPPPAPAPGGGGSPQPGNPGCVIPSSGPWPPCATGGGSPQPGNPGCIIPPTGPWPPCATGGSSAGTPVPGVPGCVIPPSGPWPPCATGSGGGSPAPAPANPPSNPAPPAAPPTNSTGFKMGGQTHTLSNPQLMLDNGLNWVKFQHKWSKGDTGASIAGRISDAHARGFKVLMSMPGSDHSNIDFGAYTEFLRSVAQLPDPPDAIEVWNEMNIDREWPTGQISGRQYTEQMLKPAYEAIKAANPNIYVISGAPAPTGFFGGACTPQGCDDAPYIREMVAAGAVNYMDCLGIHYNEGIIPPSQRSGDPRGNGGHYTRYYWGMVDTYWDAISGQRPLCFTELGYLSGDDYGGLPAGFVWAENTTIAEHAQWLGEATRLSKDSPKVDMLIIFNVDFTLFDGSDPQAGFAMIRRDGSCPSCGPIRQALGR